LFSTPSPPRTKRSKLRVSRTARVNRIAPNPRNGTLQSDIADTASRCQALGGIITRGGGIEQRVPTAAWHPAITATPGWTNPSLPIISPLPRLVSAPPDGDRPVCTLRLTFHAQELQDVGRPVLKIFTIQMTALLTRLNFVAEAVGKFRGLSHGYARPSHAIHSRG
jgi:hypothetical protein